MAIDYSQYSPDLASSSLYETRPTGGRSPAANRNISRIRTYFRRPRNYNKRMAGLGYALPNIGGLRLKEVNTAQGRRTAIMGGPGNFTYGLAGANARKDMMIGRDASGRITLVRRGARPGTPGAPAGSTAPPSPQAPGPDEFTKYEKENPWIASYLRSLRDEGAAFQTKYEKDFLPNITNALTGFSNLGVQAADRYARAAGASVAANQAAANIAPTEAAGATGAFDPISLAASQAASRATGDAAAENNRMNATLSALGPASASQGILANIQRGYSSISAEYTRKRLDDQMKLDQWIQDQESERLNREVQQQYNLGMLGVQQGQLNLATTKAENDRIEAANRASREGQFTKAELVAKGFRPVPASAGPKSMAAVQAAGIVTALDGGQYYKPRSGGGSGGRPATPQQQADVWKSLREAYNGNTRDAQGNLLNTGSSGFRDQDFNSQVQSVYAFIVNQISSGVLPPNIDAVRTAISNGIPDIQVKSGDGIGYSPHPNPAYARKSLINQVIGQARRTRVIK